MRLLRNLLSKVPTRRFAQVHDVQIKLERPNGTTRAAAFEPREATEAIEGGSKGTMERNVFHQPLTLHSTRPLTGFLRTGYCEAPRSDIGNHSVAGIVTNEFLDFSASRGNDLRQAGLTEGCKWCLCVSRWKEAFDARIGDADKKVPKVVLKATNERALESVKLEELKKFAVDAENNGS